MIAVERVDGRAGFLALEAEWAGLLRRSAGADIFVSHDWISLWLDHFGEGKDLWFLSLRDGGRLDGIIPLVRERERWKGVPVRTLRFPLERAVQITRCGFLLADGAGPLIDAFLGYLAARAGEWDVLHLEGFRSGSEQLDCLEKAAREAGYSVSPRYVAQVACYLSIDTDWAGYLRGKTGHFRKRLKEERARLEKFGRISFSLHRDPAQVADAMPKILAVLSARMGVRSVEDADPRDERLIRYASAIAERFSAKGALEIRLACIDGRPAACLLSAVRDGIVYTILTKYDPYFEHASPGKAVFRYLLEDAASQGYREIDFLSSWSYVARFSSGTREFAGLRIYNKGCFAGLVRIGREVVMPAARAAARFGLGPTAKAGYAADEGGGAAGGRAR